eukprot:2331949-Alexandrium_andersonii.AAC.1
MSGTTDPRRARIPARPECADPRRRRQGTGPPLSTGCRPGGIRKRKCARVQFPDPGGRSWKS